MSDIHFILGRIAAADGDEKEARKQFEKGLKQSPTRKIATRFNWRLGWLDYQNGKNDEAAKQFLLGEKRDADDTGRFAYWAARSLKAAGKEVAAEKKINKLRVTMPHTYYGAHCKKGGHSLHRLRHRSSRQRGACSARKTVRSQKGVF